MPKKSKANIEVGTTEEQLQRFNDFCSARHSKWTHGSLPKWTPCKCPCLQGNSCNPFVWAKLQYGGGDET